MRALDTVALLTWPLESLADGLCVSGQLQEVARHAPERALILENQGPRFESPSQRGLAAARAAAMQTGDLSGLSSVDLEILAIALEHNIELVTDDYRLQNICTHISHPWSGVVQDGITETWSWTLKCRGCGREHPASPSERKNAHGQCQECGADLRLIKK